MPVFEKQCWIGELNIGSCTIALAKLGSSLTIFFSMGPGTFFLVWSLWWRKGGEANPNYITLRK